MYFLHGTYISLSLNWSVRICPNCFKMCLQGSRINFLRLDADAHKEGTPRALELAAVTGKIDAFFMLADHLQLNRQIDQRFQLGQV